MKLKYLKGTADSSNLKLLLHNYNLQAPTSQNSCLSYKPNTSLGSPHNLRRYKSVSETTIPGGNDSAPRGFVGTYIWEENQMQTNYY